MLTHFNEKRLPVKVFLISTFTTLLTNYHIITSKNIEQSKNVCYHIMKPVLN